MPRSRMRCRDGRIHYKENDPKRPEHRGGMQTRPRCFSAQNGKKDKSSPCPQAQAVLHYKGIAIKCTKNGGIPLKRLHGFAHCAAALVLAVVLCFGVPAASAAEEPADTAAATTIGGANTTLIPAEEENCLSWLFGSGDKITVPYLNVKGQGLKKNVTLDLTDCLVGITYTELGSIGSYVSASAAVVLADAAPLSAAMSVPARHSRLGRPRRWPSIPTWNIPSSTVLPPMR